MSVVTLACVLLAFGPPLIIYALLVLVGVVWMRDLASAWLDARSRAILTYVAVLGSAAFIVALVQRLVRLAS